MELSTFDHSSNTMGFPYTEVIVVRHGETQWNIEGRQQGQLDVELNEIGRQQAILVADRLGKVPNISAVYSSDLKRAFVTADAIASSCDGLGVIVDQDLRERHVGVLQGVVLRDAPELEPEAYLAYTSRRTDQEIPGGGESLDQLYQRASSCLQRIADKNRGKRIVVVSHEKTILQMYRRACPNGRPITSLPNTSLNIFHIFGSKWILKVLGDNSHINPNKY